MAYKSFSLKDVKQQFNIHVIEHEKLFAHVEHAKPGEFLQTSLNKYVPLALAVNTEKARSEWIVAPILAELRERYADRISLFSGKKFDVDPSRGLDGYCDYIVSLSTEQYYIAAPILTIVEAKNEDIVEGLGQCLAAMIAAWIFNEQEHSRIPAVYGAVTTGTNWKFMKLVELTAYIDNEEYYLQDIDLLMGILGYITQVDRNA